MKTGFSSGVTAGSNCLRACRSMGYADWTCLPALFGNHTPERSGCPSSARGAGPPGGKGCQVSEPAEVFSGTFMSCAEAEAIKMNSAARAAPATPKKAPNSGLIPLILSLSFFWVGDQTLYHF